MKNLTDCLICESLVKDINKCKKGGTLYMMQMDKSKISTVSIDTVKKVKMGDTVRIDIYVSSNPFELEMFSIYNNLTEDDKLPMKITIVPVLSRTGKVTNKSIIIGTEPEYIKSYIETDAAERSEEISNKIAELQNQIASLEKQKSSIEKKASRSLSD